MEARMASKPAFDGRSLVGTVVVHHQMHVEFLRHRLFDRAQELQELLRAMPSMQLTDDFAGGDIQGRKQRRGAMAAVVMRSPLRHAGHHRQDRLRAIQGLNLALLVHAQHQRSVGWVQVQPHDVAHLLDEERIGGELEGLGTMRLQTKGVARCASPRVCDSPLALAIMRLLQCVAARGFSCSVLAITRSTCASLMVRGAPGRGSSSSPSSRRATKRPRHLPTVCVVTCSWRAISRLERSC